MSIRNAVLLPVLFALGVFLTGCGGGGGASIEDKGNVNPPVVDTGRTLTGTVVSSSTGKGVANVVIRFTGLTITGKTGTDGAFSIKVPSGTSLPVHFQVDTSQVASAYPTGNVVKYNSQYYEPDMVDLPIGLLNEQTNMIGEITVYEYANDTAPPPPYASKNTVIMGRVINNSTGAGVAGAQVSFGTSPDPIYPTTTGKAGYFAIDLGFDKSVLSLYPSASVKFTVKLGEAASQFPSTAIVSFLSVNYALGSSISVPAEVVAGETNDLGSLYILESGTVSGDTGGDDGPPPPP